MSRSGEIKDYMIKSYIKSRCQPSDMLYSTVPTLQYRVCAHWHALSKFKNRIELNYDVHLAVNGILRRMIVHYMFHYGFYFT